MINGNKSKVWIGLANVKPTENNFSFSHTKRAFVNILCMAKNKEEYIENVSLALKEIDFELIEIDDVEMLDARKDLYNVPEEILLKEKKIRKEGGVDFGNFHTYEPE